MIVVRYRRQPVVGARKAAHDAVARSQGPKTGGALDRVGQDKMDGAVARTHPALLALRAGRCQLLPLGRGAIMERAGPAPTCAADAELLTAAR